MQINCDKYDTLGLSYDQQMFIIFTNQLLFPF